MTLFAMACGPRSRDRWDGQSQ